MRNPWQLYDDLVDQIPAGIRVVDAMLGRQGAVRTDHDAVGLAMPYTIGPRAEREAYAVVGRDLRDVAALARSWDLRLATLGVAAMNAWYSSAEHLDALDGLRRETGFFDDAPERLAGRRTVVVGHFPDVDDLPGVTVLERDPRGADLPDAAAEYVIPGAEVVVVTGSTLVNKTLPRLLELAADAEVHLVGPTSVAAPGVLPACVRGVHGAQVVAPDAVMAAIRVGQRPAPDDQRRFHLVRG